MLTQITTTQNKNYKFIRSLKQKKERMKNRLFMVEGIKSVQDAIEAGYGIRMLAMSDAFLKDGAFAIPQEIPCYTMPESMFSVLCDTETPQGILAVLCMPEQEVSLQKDGLYLYCDAVSDPGNLGTIIRTADAAGFCGVLLSDGCVDLYNPKTVRASMGSFFHIPIVEHISKEKLAKWQEEGFQLLCGALREDTVCYLDVDMKKPTILAVGNEANGISDAVLDMADVCIKIPICGRAESLNVGIAAGILMFEAVRQRNL